MQRKRDKAGIPLLWNFEFKQARRTCKDLVGGMREQGFMLKVGSFKSQKSCI